MKRALPAVLIAMGLASGVLAQEGTLSLEVDITQLYMWRGLDLLDGDEVEALADVGDVLDVY